uniref:hypothetical protein n=1 Tax=Mycobacterium avium TaxID=1764 RepID=UPI000A728ADF
MEQVRAAAVEAYAQRGSCLDEHEFGRLVTYAVAQVRDTPEEGLYGAWQSEDWTQAEPDEDEAQIEKLVAKELQRIEVRRRVGLLEAQKLLDACADQSLDGVAFLET